MDKKSVMHVQSCCFANQIYCFFAVLVAVRVVVAREFTQRRRRQRERQKSNTFRQAKQQDSARAKRFFVHFSAVVARLQRETA